MWLSSPTQIKPPTPLSLSLSFSLSLAFYIIYNSLIPIYYLIMDKGIHYKSQSSFIHADRSVIGPGAALYVK